MLDLETTGSCQFRLRLVLGGQEASYIEFLETDYEIEVIHLETHPDYRGRGLMIRLLNVLFDRRKDVFLEVSTGNEPARKLYDRLNFEQIGSRKKYYKDGSDALLLAKYAHKRVEQAV